jgi:3-dehydroquinate synthetase
MAMSLRLQLSQLRAATSQNSTSITTVLDVVPSQALGISAVTQFPSTPGFRGPSVLPECCDEAIGIGVSKHFYVISLGDGVVNNLSGVVASMVYRGIARIHITTTTLGMLEASIDLKEAVNHKLTENLL